MSKKKSGVEFIEYIIPPCYTVNESKEKKGSIHCCSTGTNKGMSDNAWELFANKCEVQFGGRLQEFYHHVNADHQDFTIFLKILPNE